MIKPRADIEHAPQVILVKNPRHQKVRLDFNENSWGCSPRVLEAIRNITTTEISAYPEYFRLLEKLSSHLEIPQECLLVTNGSDGAIRSIIDAYTQSGDEVVIPVPTFPMYAIYCNLDGVRVINVPFEPDLSFPLEGLLQAINDRTKIVVTVNPNSPTGDSIRREDMERILESARNAVVISDEAYFEFCGKTFMDLIRIYRNLFVLRSFSKAYGLAGLRVGYAVSAEENIIHLGKANIPFRVNNVAIKAACVALDDQDFIKDMVSKMNIEKEFLLRKLNELGIPCRNTETNFILANTGKNTDRICCELREHNILITNLSKAPLLEGYVRITVGKREEMLGLLVVFEKNCN